MPNSGLRTWLTVLGVGLAILWIAGLGSFGPTRAIAWLDLIGAVLSFIGVAATTAETTVNTRASGTILLGLGVFASWLIGLVNVAVPWMVWWTFAFACAYLILGIASTVPPQELKEKEKPFEFRRSA